jgi:hypothetical protein
MTFRHLLCALLLAGCNPAPLDGGGPTPSGGGPSLRFDAPARYPAGPSPHQIAIADFDDDGVPDLAVAGGFQVALLRGLGSGLFQPWSSFPSGRGAMAIAALDLDGDGAADLVTAGDGLSIFLGAGDGTFEESPAPDLNLGSAPRLLAGADWNGDHHFDLVVGVVARDSVAVLLGRGDGSFHPPAIVTVGQGLQQIAVADLDGDGLPDLAGAALDESAVKLLLGRGDGTFDPPRRIAADGPWDLAAGDLDGDGRADLVTLGQGLPGATPVDLWLGLGGATFAHSARLAAPIGTGQLAIGDVDGDGSRDVIASSSFAGVTIFFDPAGPAPQSFAFAGGPWQTALSVADLDADGRDDLALLDSGAIDVILARPQRGLRSAVALATDGAPHAVAVADLDRDGKPDLVVGGSGLGWVRGGHGPATLSALPSDPGGGDIHSILSTDLGGDRAADLVLFRSTATVLLRGGISSVIAPAATTGAAGDFNGDRRIDLALVEPDADGAATIEVLPGRGDGTFGAPIQSAAGSSVSTAAAADWNRDGLTDLATGAADGQGVAIRVASPDGSFRAPVRYAGGLAVSALVAADLNGDTVVDLAAVGRATPDGQAALYLLLGIGDGSFRPSAPIALPAAATSIVAADLNLDGAIDLALAGRNLYLLTGAGDGSFSAPSLEVCGNAQSVAAVDLDGDDLPDLATTNEVARAVDILWNRTR